MATLSSIYEAFPLDISKNDIRVLHLLPKNVSEVSEEKGQVVVSEVPSRENPFGVTREQINPDSQESSLQGGTAVKSENNEQQESSSNFLTGLAKKVEGKSVEELMTSFTPESLKDAIAKLKDLQAQRSIRPEPTELIAAPLVDPVKDVHAGLQTNEDTLSPLSGSLEVVPVQGGTNYIALSYVWGNSSQKFSFLLNGHKVEITENLATALQHIQSLDEVVHLWVDAVCINQEDKSEKSEQVQKMKKIYENASSVLVWLGPASNDSDSIMDFAIKNGPGYVEQGEYYTATSTLTEGSGVVKTFLEANPTMRNLMKGPQISRLVDALSSLLYRDYWYRVWVLQEIAVGKNVDVACGNKKCPLEAFETTAVTMTHILASSALNLITTDSWVQLAAEGSVTALTKAPVSSPALRMLKERRWYQSKIRRRLVWILNHARSLGVVDTRLRATDPRDHIYALLGMAANTDELGIIPDYTKSVEEIYTEVAGKILEHDFDLLLMSQSGMSQRVPSWVPDWREDLKESPGNCAGFTKPFRAYGQVQPILPTLRKESLKDNPTILEVTGTRVDVVSSTGAIFRNDKYENFLPNVTWLPSIQLFLAQIENFCHRSAALDSKVYGDLKTWLKDALVRIPVGDCERISPERDRRRLSEETSQPRYESLIAFLNMINNPIDDNNLSDMLMIEWSKFLVYLTDMHRLADRRPFMTEKGYIGIGSAALRPGDNVCIFFGAHVPYVMRQESENPLRFSLVGDAYVYGIMDGEIMTAEYRKEVFELI